MTARVLSMRSRLAPVGKPCGSGTVKDGVSPPCGRTDTRPYAAGHRCPAHPPPSTASLRAFDLFAVPVRQVLEEVA